MFYLLDVCVGAGRQEDGVVCARRLALGDDVVRAAIGVGHQEDDVGRARRLALGDDVVRPAAGVGSREDDVVHVVVDEVLEIG